MSTGTTGADLDATEPVDERHTYDVFLHDRTLTITARTWALDEARYVFHNGEPNAKIHPDDIVAVFTASMVLGVIDRDSQPAPSIVQHDGRSYATPPGASWSTPWGQQRGMPYGSGS